MDIDAHAKHIARLLEFKEWAEAKIAELEAKLLGEPVAEERLDGNIVGSYIEPQPEEHAAEPVEVAEEEKAAE